MSLYFGVTLSIALLLKQRFIAVITKPKPSFLTSNARAPERASVIICFHGAGRLQSRLNLHLTVPEEESTKENNS